VHVCKTRKRNAAHFYDASSPYCPERHRSGKIDSHGKLGAVTIGGDLTFSSTVESDTDTSSSTPTNGSAQIGSVTVGANWVASNLIAGTTAGIDGLFGTADDARISTSAEPTLKSSIGSVVIVGQVLGIPGDNPTTTHFGIVSQQFGSVKIGGSSVTIPAPGTPLVLGSTGLPTGDFALVVVA